MGEHVLIKDAQHADSASVYVVCLLWRNCLQTTLYLRKCWFYYTVLKFLMLILVFFKYLAKDGVPKKLPNSIKLKILKLYQLSFDKCDEVASLYTLISSYPMIRRIESEMGFRKHVDPAPVLEFLKTLDYTDITLDELQEVRLTFVSGMEAELDFVKPLLAKSSMLEIMLIKTMFEDKDAVLRLELLKKLARFRRASKLQRSSMNKMTPQE